MNYNNLCYRCFAEKPIAEKPCPHCGYDHKSNTVRPNCLLPGTLLHNRYIVGVALGVGGFGITYKCMDTNIGGICAIKEYFPANYAVRDNHRKQINVEPQNLERYNKILKRFVEEAVLVKTLRHKNIITIYDSFFENNTAYYVMEYCDGVDLRRYTNNFSRKLGYDEGINILYQIMNGLEYIHGKGILHRDIAPDNIYVTRNNSVKILDFGSARKEMDQFNRELSAIVKVGYAPIEQYGGRGKQGPYTDIYALGATFYHLFTGITPVESTQRVAEDSLTDFSRLRPDLPDSLKFCIERSMALTVAKRISSIGEMKRILGFENPSINKDKQIATAFNGADTKYSAKNNPVTTPHNISGRGNFRLADIGSRIGAYILDYMIWLIVFIVILAGAFGINNASIKMMVLYPLVFTVINTVTELCTSATLGKMMLGMRICGKNGAKATPSQILLRNIIKILGVFTLIFKDNYKLLHDKATGSVVYQKK